MISNNFIFIVLFAKESPNNALQQLYNNFTTTTNFKLKLQITPVKYKMARVSI